MNLKVGDLVKININHNNYRLWPPHLRAEIKNKVYPIMEVTELYYILNIKDWSSWTEDEVIKVRKKLTVII